MTFRQPVPLSDLLESVNKSFCTSLVIVDCDSVAFFPKLVIQLSKEPLLLWLSETSGLVICPESVRFSVNCRS